MKRRLPPAGLPLRTSHVIGALAGWARPREAREALEREIAHLFPQRAARAAVSGRAALFRAFRLAREERPRADELVLGGYTCWSVAAAAVRAGFRLRPVDLDPATLDFDGGSLDGIDFSLAGAIVTHHLFGLPNDRGVLLRAAARSGAPLIDDAAQAFGAEEGGRLVGGAGDAGVLSFGRGKSLPALGGGVLLLDRESPLGRGAPADDRIARGTAAFCRAAAHRVFFAPWAYAWIADLPFLRIGETIYDPTFRIGAIDGYTAALALHMLKTQRAIVARRRETAAAYAALLSDSKGVRIPIPLPGSAPAYLRFPVLVPPEKRGEILRRGRPLGIGPSYPAPIARIPGLPRGALAGEPSLPGCEEIAQRVVTLPTHPLVTETDRAKIAALLREVCG
ncbi:MAG: DegT/DnrJ/EryC1/StrS family aminotransferase [Candidatus Eisenbacteria bacterium]|nr:DegT/DnrJ/EryC1/StrS family aminotransferase [Candidatus Eisenbacteria bacterium]